jgi:hypothetical protein
MKVDHVRSHPSMKLTRISKWMRMHGFEPGRIFESMALTRPRANVMKDIRAIETPPICA